MKSKKSISALVILFIFFFSANFIYSQITPLEVSLQIKRGINIGNAMEPPTEGGWNNGVVKEYYFDDYKAAGFTCIRIPVRWDKHTSEVSPYTIDAAWLTRVEQVIDWGLNRGLFVILNAHHDDWLKTNYANASTRARFDSIWVQIARKFKGKSEKLLFEILNEPNGMSVQQVDDMNLRIIPIIRQTNPTRIIIYCGNGYSTSGSLMAAVVPNDSYIMGYFHSYDPWSFAGQGQGTWGTAADVNSLRSMFQSVANWSAIKNVRVMISEFGAVKTCDYNSRMYHYSTYVEEALNKGIGFQVWDDGGDFGIYNRAARTWSEVKDILTKTYPQGPTSLKINVFNDTIVNLAWTNRIISEAGIKIERRTDNGAFTEIASLNSTSSIFRDTTAKTGKTYYYRVIVYKNPDHMYSYPVRVIIPPNSGTSINDEQTQAAIFSVYPNPAGDYFNINFNKSGSNGTIELYNILGQLMKRIDMNGKSSRLEVKDLSKGVYFMRAVINKTNVFTKKVMIQ